MIFVGAECSSPALGSAISAFHKMMTLIQIIVPILLIIGSAINLIRLVHNPDDQKRKKRLLNSVIAAVLVFFIPMFVDAVMGMVGDNYTVSACWNSATNPGSSTSYVDPYDQGKKSGFIINPSDYEKGKKKTYDGGSSQEQLGNMTYNVYVPDNATDGLPMLVWLHGDGSSGTSSTAKTLGKTAEKAGYPAIIVAPFSPNMGSSGNPGWYEGKHLGEVKSIADTVCAKYNCNRNNINIGGHSRGAIGAWMMGSTYGSYFHAVAPVSCCKSSGFKPQNYKGLKVWAMRGSGAGSGSSNDDIYGSCMQSSVNAVKPYAKAVHYTILPGTSHGGAGGNAVSNTEMMKFIFSN